MKRAFKAKKKKGLSMKQIAKFFGRLESDFKVKLLA